MGLTALVGASLLDPEAGAPAAGGLLIEAGRIRERLAPGAAPPESAEVVDLAGHALAPGFLDLHYHGSLVLDAVERVPAELRQAASRGLRHGVTGFLPTTVAWPAPELMTRVSAFVEGATSLSGPLDATVLGVHLEGPWIAADAAGAQPRKGIRGYRAEEGDALWDRLEGLCRMVTLAPEVEGHDALLDALARRGIVASLGHSQADDASVTHAIELGASHVTHLFNAMGGLHHRTVGLAGRALLEPRLSCDLICDGVHVHPDVVRLAASQTRDRLVLITDRIELPGSEDGTDRDGSGFGSGPSGDGQGFGSGPSGDGQGFGSGPVRDEQGAWRLPGGQLAGSTLTMDRAVRNAAGFGAMDRLQAVAAATLRPARVLGLEHERGTLRPGTRADLVVLDADGRVQQTWLGGTRAWTAS